MQGQWKLSLMVTLDTGEGWEAVVMRRGFMSTCEGCTAAVWVIYEVLSEEATRWRVVLDRLRDGAFAARSLLVSDGCVSACGVPASPTSSRRNLNLDRKSCQTTYQPNSMKSSAQTSVATMTSSVSPTLCHILAGHLIAPPA